MATPGEIREAGLEGKVASEIVSAQSRISPDDEMAKLHHAGVEVINWHDPQYPTRLKEISDPPPVLYFKGELLPSDERAVAVVGTRSPTSYGQEVAASLTTDLARTGITIVSGLALGIDRSSGGAGQRRPHHSGGGQRVGHRLS